jgi:hypothetical protein
MTDQWKNTGLLNINPRSDPQTLFSTSRARRNPDWIGQANVNGKVFQVAAWQGEGDGGSYLRIVLTPGRFRECSDSDFDAED